MTTENTIHFAFFGSSRLSVIVLDELKRLGLVPSFIVSTSDKLIGRHQDLTPNVVKQWATRNGLEGFSPAKLDTQFIAQIRDLSSKKNIQVFLVASYSRIMPDELINIPPRNTLNIHPSLLPKYRGPAPMPATIMADDKKTGVTLMRIDREMDHGPIVAVEEVTIAEWPTYEEYEEKMAVIGARLFAESLPEWVAGKIKEKKQDHSRATYTKKMVKEDGLLDLSAPAYDNFRKIQAYHEWPGSYFFVEKGGKNIRVKVTKAEFRDGKLSIQKVLPEGSKEMDLPDFERGYGKLDMSND